MNRRQLLAAPVALAVAQARAVAASRKPIFFWFYTSEAISLRTAPVSDFEFSVASVDLPCHGQDLRKGEPQELAGWRYRVDNGEDLLSAFIEKCRFKLDRLIEVGANPELVFAAGGSRGAFAAMQLSLADPRFTNIVGLAPVVDLMALREFDGCQKAPPPLADFADTLAKRSIFLSIAAQDTRVSTTKAVDLVTRIASGRRDADIELVVERGTEHEFSASSMRAARNWIDRKLAKT